MTNSHEHSGQVVVAVDGSPASLEALRLGHRMAELFGNELVAATAWQPFRRAVSPAAGSHPQQNAEQLVYRSVVEAFHGTVPPPVRIVAAEGDAAEVLMELSHDADLLVVGSHGHWSVVGAVLGSVSTRCAAHAHCPVLVVHAPPTTEPAASAADGAAVERRTSEPLPVVVTY